MTEDAEKKTEKDAGESRLIKIVCPICKSIKDIKVPEKPVLECKRLFTLSIQEKLICEHHFQAFIDKQFNVRGYQQVDLIIEFSNTDLEIQDKEIETSDINALKNLLLKKLEKEKENIQIWKKLGEIFYKVKRFENAEYCFKKIANLDQTNAQAWEDLGVFYYHIDKIDEAIYFLEFATKIDSSRIKVWDLIGISYGKLKDYKKSIEAFKKAIEFDSSFPNSWYNLASVYQAKGKNRMARDVLKKARESKVSFGGLKGKVWKLTKILEN